MRRVSIYMAALVISDGATPALAVHFAPKGTRFQLNGTMDMSKTPSKQGFGCPFIFDGHITSQGTIEITKANFCKEVAPSALPWTWQATGVRPKDGVASMTFGIKAHDCGEIKDQIFVSDGYIHFTGEVSAKHCAINGGDGLATPKITIKP